MHSSLKWIDKMQFSAKNEQGRDVLMDASSDHGGDGNAPTPKQLLLDAMLGCTAMDVVSMLQKMRQTITEFNIDIEAEKNQDYPVHFKTAVLVYHLKGAIMPEKAIKAVEASLTKYCGVNYMVSKTCHTTYKLFLNGALIQEGEAAFVDPAK